MNDKIKQLVIQALRTGEDYESIIHALEQSIKEMKVARQYLDAYLEKDYHP